MMFAIAEMRKITGDDTPALQAVLDADVWRKVLLKEQEVSFGDEEQWIKACTDINCRKSRSAWES